MPANLPPSLAAKVIAAHEAVVHAANIGQTRSGIDFAALGDGALRGANVPVIGSSAHLPGESALRPGETAARREHRDGLEIISNYEVRRAIWQALDGSARLYGRIGLITPSIEDFLENSRTSMGKAFDRNHLLHLAAEYERMAAKELEPQAVLTPHGLGCNNWKALYAAMTPIYPRDAHGKPDFTQLLIDNRGIPNNPLKPHANGHGLWVDDDVARNWATLDVAPVGTPTFSALAQSASIIPTSSATPNSTSSSSELHWTIRLIPGTAEPPKTNISYKQHIDHGGTHPTLPEYLILQANRIQNGQVPIDRDLWWAWLQGEFNTKDGARAPLGGWNAVSGRVRMGSVGVGSSFDSVGVRSLVG